jgi:hypothetical protein
MAHEFTADRPALDKGTFTLKSLGAAFVVIVSGIWWSASLISDNQNKLNEHTVAISELQTESRATASTIYDVKLEVDKISMKQDEMADEEKRAFKEAHDR